MISNRFKWVSYVVLALFLGGLALSFALPNEYFVERTVEIQATKEKIAYELVNLNEWEDWNPWYESDPKAKLTYEGPTGAVGSMMIWDGPKMGMGRIEITKITNNDDIVFQFGVTQPSSLIGQGQITIETGDKSYVVRWKMTGPLESPFERLMGPLLERRLGSDFARGLKNLKAFVEIEKNPFETSPPGSLLKAEQEKEQGKEKEKHQNLETKIEVAKPVAEKSVSPAAVANPAVAKKSTREIIREKFLSEPKNQESVDPNTPNQSEDSMGDQAIAPPADPENEETIASPMESELTGPADSSEEPRNPDSEETERIPSGKIDYE